MVIDRRKNTRKLITLPHDLLREIEAWRATQNPIPAESEAIRRLLRRALDAERWATEAKKPGGNP